MSSYRPSPNFVGIVIVWMLFFLFIGIVGTYLGFFGDWAKTPTEVFSPRNVQNLSRIANEEYQALLALEANIDSSEAAELDFLQAYGEDQAKWPLGKRDQYMQAQAHTRNAIAAYNIRCAKYNALWEDEWKNLPAPDDLPTRCTLR